MEVFFARSHALFARRIQFGYSYGAHQIHWGAVSLIYDMAEAAVSARPPSVTTPRLGTRACTRFHPPCQAPVLEIVTFPLQSQVCPTILESTVSCSKIEIGFSRLWKRA